MIYKTTGFKKINKHGRKSKRNMSGGNGGQWFVGIPIGVVAGIIVVLFLIAFGIILKGGGGKSRTQ